MEWVLVLFTVLMAFAVFFLSRIASAQSEIISLLREFSPSIESLASTQSDINERVSNIEANISIITDHYRPLEDIHGTQKTQAGRPGKIKTFR